MLDSLKGALHSKVIWFNTLMAALVPAVDYAQVALPTIQPYVPVNLYGKAFVAMVAVNIYLRFKTAMSLSEKAHPDDKGA